MSVYDCIICGEQNTSINYDMACSIVCGKNNYSYSSSQYFAFTNAIVGGEGNHAHRNGLTIGTYCEDIASSNSDSYLVVGIGSDGNNRRTGLRFNSSGDLFIAGQLHQGGADYAVCLEWLDGNPNGEDRRGRLVALEGEKITFANGKDIYGVISGDSTVVENAAPNEWHGRYLRDIFGTIARNNRGEPIKNPYYIEPTDDAPYIPRLERREYDAVGKIGIVVAIDDGTCEVNGYCKAINGIATKSKRKTGLRVMKRLDDTHIKVALN